MEMNAAQIENVVRQVLSQMGGASAPAKAPEIPATARVAMLTGERKIEVREYPIPPVGDDEILVKVEGCGVCGTDVHEWKGDPFGLAPVVLGHEGTGEILALGKNIKVDTQGHPLKVGDKIVTSVTSCGECGICRMHPDTVNLCDKQGIFGLIPDSDEYHLNGWFSTHLLIHGAHATYFKVNELDLQERMLLELAAVCVHALLRGQKTGLLNFNSKVVLQGCGPVGLMMLCVLRAAGINHIIAIDGAPKRLELAREMNIPIKKLITHSFPLDQMNEAMEVNIAQKGIKICYVAE